MQFEYSTSVKPQKVRVPWSSWHPYLQSPKIFSTTALFVAQILCSSSPQNVTESIISSLIFDKILTTTLHLKMNINLCKEIGVIHNLSRQKENGFPFFICLHKTIGCLQGGRDESKNLKRDST